MNVLDNLQYTSSHEWVKVEGDVAIIGITDFAQQQLGDIVFVDVDCEGEEFEKGEAFGSIEAVKTVEDIKLPIGGEVIEVNEELADQADLINKEPFEGGWIVKIKIEDAAELDELLDAESYKALIAE